MCAWGGSCSTMSPLGLMLMASVRDQLAVSMLCVSRCSAVHSISGVQSGRMQTASKL